MSQEKNDPAIEETEENDQDANTEAAIQEAFDVAIASDPALEEDDIKLGLIGAGATFKNVTRLYNTMMVKAGLAISKEDKSAFVNETLENLEYEDEEGYDKAVAALMDEDKQINERSAGALLRAYAKKNDQGIYQKPKVEGSGRVGFVAGYYDFLIANPRVTEKDAKTFVMDPKNSDNVHRHAPHYMNIWKLVSSVVEAFDAEGDAPPVAEVASI